MKGDAAVVKKKGWGWQLLQSQPCTKPRTNQNSKSFKYSIENPAHSSQHRSDDRQPFGCSQGHPVAQLWASELTSMPQVQHQGYDGSTVLVHLEMQPPGGKILQEIGKLLAGVLCGPAQASYNRTSEIRDQHPQHPSLSPRPALLVISPSLTPSPLSLLPIS